MSTGKAVVAKGGAGAGMTPSATRSKKIGGDSRYKATMAADVFRVYMPGRMVFNPETGMVEECQRDEVVGGQIGHTYKHGVINDNMTVASRPSKLRMLKEKWLLKLKGFFK